MPGMAQPCAMLWTRAGSRRRVCLKRLCEDSGVAPGHVAPPRVDDMPKRAAGVCSGSPVRGERLPLRMPGTPVPQAGLVKNLPHAYKPMPFVSL
ncbi:MAG: hypothetical protein JWQ73_3939 [Variovorax sp.]|nr:hypothetical protein [Variovorax sp.]